MEERDKKLKVLAKLAADLNESDLIWAVGASAMLFLRGIVREFHDIDLLVCEEDVEKAKEILLRHGTLLPTQPDDRFGSHHFLEFDVDGVEIDLIAGFVVNSADGKQHVCPLQVEEVDACVDVLDQAIALHSLNVWYQYYTWMGRKDRIKNIEDYFAIK